MVASAPSSRNVLKTCRLRPAATTRPAPRKLRLPLRPVRQSLPVAPRMRTFSPGASFARKMSKSQAETPGLCRAAAVSARRPANCSPCRRFRISRIGDVQREAQRRQVQTGFPLSSRSTSVSLPFTTSRARTRSAVSCLTFDPVRAISSPFAKLTPMSSRKDFGHR